ncbi:MAG: glycosyltransferase family 4 protein [Planctomycetes bacterium]|nr:glycosyltransferase family 4 protein [Planctomycetota bacterium]
MRLLYVSNIPSPYQLELFGHIAGTGLADVRALFCMESYPGRGWKKPVLPPGFEVLPHWKLQWIMPDLVFSFGVGRRIRDFKPDVAIVGSYVFPGVQRAVGVLTRMRTPWLLWGEFHRFSTNRVKRFLRKRLLLRALHRAAAVFGIGTRAVSFFQDLAGGATPVYNFPYASDLARFTNEPRRAGPGVTRFLYSGQMIERKGVDVLLKAFAEVASAHSRAELVLLGDGPLRHELEAMVPRELSNRVRFEGNVPWADLPKHYAAAHVLVLPSRHDGWGMVIPEAMAAGMPVISTGEVGAALDLVENGRTGFLFDKDDAAALAGHIGFFVENHGEVSKMGKVASERVKHLDAAQAGPRLIEILQEYAPTTAKEARP